MPGPEVWTLTAAALAVVALLGAALLARRLSRLGRELADLRAATPAVHAAPAAPEPEPAEERPHVVTSLPERRPATSALPVDDLAVDDLATDDQVVLTTEDGRTVVLPTRAQVRDATLGRPLVRSAVVGHGIWHALRPESRDRIRGIVRREFRRRKRVRLAAGRRAARTAPVDLRASQAWLGSATPPDRGPQ